MLADVFTPVGIYLRLRDRFRDTVLLESTDNHAVENSWSFIGVNAIAGIEISSGDKIEFKFPGRTPEVISLNKDQHISDVLNDFMRQFDTEPVSGKEAAFARSLWIYIL